MQLIFHCEHCGQDWLEPGDRSGYNPALRHKMHQDAWHAEHPEEATAKDHDFALYDAETGEKLAVGLDKARKLAVERGWMRDSSRAAKTTGGRDEPLEDRLTKETVVRSDGMRGTPQTNARGNPLTVDFKGLTLHLPPYLYAYFAMGIRRTLRPDTGEPYTFDAQGITDYVVDFLRYGHEARLPQFLDMAAADLDTAQGRRVLAATIAAIEGLTGEELAQSIQHILEAPDTVPA